MKYYRINEYISKGMIRVASIYGLQLWVLSEQPVRKDHRCVFCFKYINKGMDRAFRPLTNLNNRMDRICEECGNPKEGIIK